MMKAYPEYIQSNIEAGLQVPLCWQVMRFRHLFSIDRGLGITKENLQDDGIPCVNYGEIHSKFGFELNLEKHSLKCVHEGFLETSPNSLLKKGDLVYADTSEDLEGSGNLTQLVSDSMTFAGYHTIIARQKRNHDFRFLAYALDSDYCRNQIRRIVKGVKVFSITQAILKDISVLLPSHEEQKAISSYLDVNTLRIDNLITEKQSFIKLLQEKRQVLISHVVTKGLDDNVKMKPSGVEWIEGIPEDWEMTPIKHLVSLRKGIAFKADDFVEEGIPVTKASDIKNKTIKEASTYLPLEFDKLYPKGVIFEDEIILSTVGSVPEVKASAVGQFGIVPSNIDGNLLNQNTIVYTADKGKVLPYFLFYTLHLSAYREYLDLNAHGTANQASLNISSMVSFALPIPPIAVQEKIVHFLSNSLSKIKKLEEETEHSIELLKEHRTALISAAVTGKIDVREEA